MNEIRPFGIPPTFRLLDKHGRALPERCTFCGGPEHQATKVFGIDVVPCPAVPSGLIIPLAPRQAR